jgi:hypothetical protein
MVVEESRTLGPFQYCRNETNIGPLRNILKGPCELAKGEFVWVLGDHNLMMPGGIIRILAMISEQASLDVFYSNFRCAGYSEHWPLEAVKGYSGPFHYLGNASVEDRSVGTWSELLTPASALCTQVYAHIVRTSIWRDYWRLLRVDQPYLDALTTYPHTKMIAEKLFDAPSYYKGEPAITIFNGAQSWGNPVTQCAVYLNGLPDLVNGFGRLGVDAATISVWKRGFCQIETARVLSSALHNLGFFWVFSRVISSARFEAYVWRAFWIGFRTSDCNMVARCLSRSDAWFKNRRNWWIYNCRPARWLSQFRSRSQGKTE